MFFEALQSYYAPTITLILFAISLMTSQLLSPREKKLFLMELGVVGLMILTTWVDRCVSSITVGEWWRLRFFTSALQFAAAPLSPLILLRIYRRNDSSRWEWLLALPVALTALLSLTSFQTGLVLRVEPGNVYSRGPLFLLPFITSALYLAFFFRSTTRRELPGRRRETIFLFCAGIAIAGACLLEIVFVIRYMIWSTTAAMLLTYFLVLTILKVTHDTQTGVYSRLAYEKQLESIQDGQQFTLAMADLNGLKHINDHYGHKSGDQAILQVTQALLSVPIRKKKLFRCGGDEFVIVVEGWCGPALEAALDQVSTHCGSLEDMPLSFAYGVVEYRGGSLRHATDEIDRLMYQKKLAMKQAGVTP